MTLSSCAFHITGTVKAEFSSAARPADNSVLGYPQKPPLCKACKDSRPSNPERRSKRPCFTRQQTTAKNPDYACRPAKAGFGEKLEKKNLSSTSPSKELGDHKRHSSTGTMTTPDARWEGEWAPAVAAGASTRRRAAVL